MSNQTVPLESQTSEVFNFNEEDNYEEGRLTPVTKPEANSPSDSNLPLLDFEANTISGGTSPLNFERLDIVGENTSMKEQPPSPSKISFNIKHQLAKVGDHWYRYKHRKVIGNHRRSSAARKPSVAFADYDISDKRSSAMSSGLLLFAMLEGICGFVLPISDAFGKANPYATNHTQEAEVDHKYYYEAFLMIQYTFSILSLIYLQGFIFYYDYYHNKLVGLENKILMQHCQDDQQSEVEDDYDEYEDKESRDSSDGRPKDLSTHNGKNSTNELQKEAVNNEENLKETAKWSHVRRKTSLDLLLPATLPKLKKTSVNSLPITLPLQNHHDFTPALPLVENHVANSNTGVQKKRAKFMIENEPRYAKPLDEIDYEPSKNQLNNQFNESQPNHRRASQMFFQKIFGDKLQESSSRKTRNGRSLAFSRDTEGVNLYLRLGAVGFGFGVMIMDGLKIADRFEKANSSSNRNCHSHLWIPKHLIHFIFVFWQTYFVFKYHKVVFNVQKFFLRFLLSHMAVANLCQWLKTIVDEITEEQKHSIHKVHSNLSLNSEIQPSNYDNDYGTYETILATCKSIAAGLTVYLSPCAIEYSLISSAIFYKMFQKIGQVQKESDRMERFRQNNLMTKGFSECHRSHRGLFVGLLMFMATIVAMALFFIFTVRNSKEHEPIPFEAMIIYQVTEISLLLIGLLTSMVCYYRLRVLKFHDLSEEGAFDGNLLLIGLIGMIFYNMFILVPASETFSVDSRNVSRLFVVKAVLEIIQSLAQVFFILEASRRCARTMEHVKRKPGRTLVVLLLIINLSMWVVNIFEVRRAGQKGVHKEYFGDMVWAIIINISLPLIIFFRFHSTVCLSDIWSHAYKFKNH